MNKEIVPFRKSKKRIVLSFWETMQHYSFVLIPLFIPGIALYYKLSDKSTVNSFAPTTQLIFVFISLLIGYIKWRELNYYELDESRTDSEFENAVLATANKINWIVNTLNNNNAEAISRDPWKSSDFQSIKIIRLSNKVMINSMTEPNIISVPDLFGLNMKNRNTFLHYYYISNKVENLNEEVIRYLKGEEERIENEPEWNMKNTLRRIALYILCLGFMGIGLAIWKYDEFNFGVLLCLIIGISYIAIDIYILWTKKIKAKS